jgi:hypothetical protein
VFVMASSMTVSQDPVPPGDVIVGATIIEHGSTWPWQGDQGDVAVEVLPGGGGPPKSCTCCESLSDESPSTTMASRAAGLIENPCANRSCRPTGLRNRNRPGAPVPAGRPMTGLPVCSPDWRVAPSVGPICVVPSAFVPDCPAVPVQS